MFSLDDTTIIISVEHTIFSTILKNNKKKISVITRPNLIELESKEKLGLIVLQKKSNQALLQALFRKGNGA